MSDDDIEIRVDGLEHLMKALKTKPPTIRVGILQDTARGDGSHVTNAFVGMMHEFGTPTVPKRSFLREPLADNLNSRLESSGALDKKTLEDVIKKATFKPWCDKIAILAEGIILGAFDTGGYGKWAPLQPGTISQKHNQQSLVETGQLRNSITSEVTE